MRRARLSSLMAAALIAVPLTAQAEPKHGIAMYGEPQLEEGFVSLPYANPDAPKGGRIVSGEAGSFDSLNPHIRKGEVPWQLRFLAYESLMGRSYDEPFTLYGLLAETPLRMCCGPMRLWAPSGIHAIRGPGKRSTRPRPWANAVCGLHLMSETASWR